MSTQSVMLKAAGLETYYQSLMELSPGALLKADNTVINRQGVIEPRRGIKAYGASFGSSVSRAKQLLEYKGRIIRHIDTTLSYDDGAGVFTNFSGVYSEPVSGYRIKSVEAKSNLYFTTSNGIKKISAATTSDLSGTDIIQDSGGPKAITGTTSVNYTTSGFLPIATKVAYRILWIYTDKNQNLIYGSPSARMVVENQSITAADSSVNITFQIPYNITANNYTNYKYQIYRSDMSATEPSDEMNRVLEGTPVLADLTPRTITITDTLAEDLRIGGVPLYTNQYSGEGILAANEPPPSARDISLFKGHMFYGNTRTRHSATISILNVSGFTSGSSDFVITNGTTTNTYTFYGTKESTQVTITGSPGVSKYFTIYSANDERKYAIWIDSTGSDVAPSVPGSILVKIPYAAYVNPSTTATQVKNSINTQLSFDFTASNVGADITIQNVNNGSSTNASAGTSSHTVTTTVAGSGEDAATKKVLIPASSDNSVAIEKMANSLVRIINAQSSEIVTAYYASNFGETPGKIILQSKNLEDTSFFIGTSDTAIVSKFSPDLGRVFTNTATTVANPTVITTSVNHTFVAGDTICIYGSDSNPTVNGKRVIATIPAVNQYSVSVDVLSATVFGNVITSKLMSSTESIVNRIYYSKYQEHEAVPILNYIDIGSGDQPILRIITLRESLFILKGDGVFRLAGDPGANPNWDVGVFDNTSIIKAPDTAITLGNQCYYFSNQGVVKLNESSLETISESIQDKLLPFITTNQNLSTAAFSVSSESDRALLVWTVSNKNDTYATVAYRFNTVTQTWTEWKIAKTCAVLNVPQDKLYFGSASDNYIEVERKNFDRFDYADREISVTLSTNGLSGQVIKPSGFTSITVEDVLYQTQYVSIYQFNALLNHLDTDNGLASDDYYSTLAIQKGDNLSSKMTALVDKLNIDDPASSYSFSGSTTFSVIQTEFNVIIGKLNTSSVTYLSNYKTSTGTVSYEAIILSLDKFKQEATLNISPSFIVGPMTLYKGIKTEIEYAPQHAGNPSAYKQFSVGNFLFDRRSFYSAQAGYNSDISDNYEEITFIPRSAGTFGGSSWGDGTTWGGLGDQGQLRTYIPLKKQRCRFLGCKFTHGVALESYELYGLSLSYRIYSISDRDYK